MDTTLDMTCSYHEEQRFRQWWLWLIVVSACLLEITVFGYGMVKQVVLHESWGNHAASIRILVIVQVSAILFGAALFWLFVSMRLVTEVRNDGLYIRFFPFVRQTIPFEDIRRCEARNYRPIGEYGGWGIRWSLLGYGKAYNVSGHRGVQLELSNGKRLLIGSQRADELAAAINAHRHAEPLKPSE